MPSRLPLYEDLLRCAREHGYRGTYSRLFLLAGSYKGRAAPDGRYLILRHDVDTDPRTAAAMWKIELRNQCTSSFFFRSSTFRPELMKAMHATGFDSSYHYEEIYPVAKQQGLSTWPQVQAVLPQIRALFQANLARLRQITGLPMRCVASHGDFINRKLKVFNTVILEDEDFRQQVGIEVEAYDAVISNRITSRGSDCLYPQFWKPVDPMLALQQGQPVVHVLDPSAAVAHFVFR